MTIRLADLTACFEGVIPSIIATAAPDGTPNISYLSHVDLVDERRIALSNQFFSKTATNVRTNPNATVLVVDARNGEQYRLRVRYERSLERGELFDAMASQLRATSAQVGMADVMRLRGVDIYHVEAIHRVPSPAGTSELLPAPNPRLLASANIVRGIGGLTEMGDIVDATLDGLRDALGHANSMLLLVEQPGECLVTIGSRGYERTGIGSEVRFGDGLIGTAAAELRAIKVSDMSRIRRFGAAIRPSVEQENRTRTILPPGLPDPMSQLAVPMIAHGALRAVLFLESPQRLAFTKEDEATLSLIAAAAAGAIALTEGDMGDAGGVSPNPAAVAAAAARFHVLHHDYDGSIFIENEYIIKGVAGRLLKYLLSRYLLEGRTDFSNREIRLAPELRLPDVKDNLETRLLLLRRRLEDKAAPVQLVRTGRGRVRLHLEGTPVLQEPTH